MKGRKWKEHPAERRTELIAERDRLVLALRANLTELYKYELRESDRRKDIPHVDALVKDLRHFCNKELIGKQYYV